MDDILTNQWDNLTLKISKQFNVIAEEDFMLFLIGIQEKGCGFQKFNKQEKMDLINLAKCRLLSIKGHTKETGIAEDGWPLFEPSSSFDNLTDNEINVILKEAMVDYFQQSNYITD